MKTLLELENSLFEELLVHLLPENITQEQAAFIFARVERNDENVALQTIDAVMLGASDFTVQEGDYLEMNDETRASLIKRAHDLDASLVEMHSHLGPWPAVFSLSDRIGLKETVPHMRWRLSKRPYLALVFCESGFDALLWLDNPNVPIALDCLSTGSRTLVPTNNSLEGWK